MPRTRPQAGEGDFAGLLDGARRRDPSCLRALYDVVVRPVAVYLRANGATDPAGSTNEVLFRALTNLDRFIGGEDQFRAWVLTIAHHLMIDERRARSRRPSEVPLPDDVEVLAAPDDPAAATEASVATRGVLAALASLPDSQRQVITLRWVGGLSLAEVAEVLGCKVGAVKALQHRGVEALRARLADTSSAGDSPADSPADSPSDSPSDSPADSPSGRAGGVSPPLDLSFTPS